MKEGRAIAWPAFWGLLIFGAAAILIVTAFSENWVSGADTFLGALVVALAAVAFTYALSVSGQQIAAGARKDLMDARDQIIALKEKIAELERKAQTQTETVASITVNAGDDEAQMALGAATAQTEELQSTAHQASLDAGAAYEKLTKATEALPEGQRLSGFWIATAFGLVLLSIVLAKDVTISSSPASSTPTEQSGSSNGADPDTSNDSNEDGAGN